MFGNDEKFDPCKMYALHETGIDSGINGACHSESFDNGTVMACESYVYDTSIFPETLTTSFNLVSNYFGCIATLVKSESPKWVVTILYHCAFNINFWQILNSYLKFDMPKALK